MGCNCGGSKRKNMGTRGLSRTAVRTSKQSLTPTDRRKLEMIVNKPIQQNMTAARREIERKRRLAIQRTFGK
jgi:hypothetical protein